MKLLSLLYIPCSLSQLEDEVLSEALMAELNLSSGRTSSSTQYASVGDSLTSDLSGSNQPREMFIPQQQLLSLTEKLHSSQPASVSIIKVTSIDCILTLRAPQATSVDKKFLPLSATGDFSRHEERLHIDTSNTGLFLL